jgi:hypothetical protein
MARLIGELNSEALGAENESHEQLGLPVYRFKDNGAHREVCQCLLDLWTDGQPIEAAKPAAKGWDGNGLDVARLDLSSECAEAGDDVFHAACLAPIASPRPMTPTQLTGFTYASRLAWRRLPWVYSIMKNLRGPGPVVRRPLVFSTSSKGGVDERLNCGGELCETCPTKTVLFGHSRIGSDPSRRG